MAWRIEIAQEDVANPLFEPKYPWDNGSIASYGTVLLDPTDGLWKMWYICRPPRPTPSSGPATGWSLAYAESRDGVHWDRPELDYRLCCIKDRRQTSCSISNRAAYRSKLP